MSQMFVDILSLIALGTGIDSAGMRGCRSDAIDDIGRVARLMLAHQRFSPLGAAN